MPPLKKELTEDNLREVIDALARAQRLDPLFPYVIIPCPFSALGLGVDNTPSDE